MHCTAYAAIRQETEVTQTALRLSRLTVMLNITQYFFADAEGLHSTMSPAARPYVVKRCVTRQSATAPLTSYSRIGIGRELREDWRRMTERLRRIQFGSSSVVRIGVLRLAAFRPDREAPAEIDH